MFFQRLQRQEKRELLVPDQDEEDKVDRLRFNDTRANATRDPLERAQKALEKQQRERLDGLQRRLVNVESRARRQARAREDVAVLLHGEQKKLARASERSEDAKEKVEREIERRKREEYEIERENEECERLWMREREEMEFSEKLRRELDAMAKERREKEDEASRADAFYETTMRETMQGQRVVSNNEKVVLEREDRVEAMMETEREIREKTKYFEEMTEQARIETDDVRKENLERASEIELQRKENARLRDRWALTVKVCEKTDEEARKLFEATGELKREDAKIKSEILAETKEIVMAKKDMTYYTTESEKFRIDTKKNEDVISACSIT
jgi:hypothetical protein